MNARKSRQRVADLEHLRSLLALDDVVVEASQEVGHALEWYARGADFADALHLAGCGNTVLHTFDRNFCEAAVAAGIAPDVYVWDVG